MIIYISETSPCEKVLIKDNCCNFWTNKLGHNLEAIMNVMRFASGRGKSSLKISDFLKRILESNDYPIANVTDVTDQESLDLGAQIPWCDYKKQKQGVKEYPYVHACNLFQPIITDMGLCHAFNPTPTADILAPSFFRDSFIKAFGDDFNQEQRIEKGIGSGRSNALDFYIFKEYNQLEEEENILKEVWMGLSTHDGYMEMKSVSQPIRFGHHTTWKVQAMEILPSEDLKEIAIEKRHCRFEDEAEDLILFTLYSQEACEFEKNILNAEKLCQCVPWYIPSKKLAGRHVICDQYGMNCFNQKMKDTQSESDGRCLPSCHQLQFTYSEVIEKRDPIAICKVDHKQEALYKTYKNEFEPNLAQELYRNKFSELLHKYHIVNNWLNAKSSNISALQALDEKAIMKEMCEDLVMNNIAKVSVFYEKKKYVKTLTNKRVTLTDKLGTFGKSEYVLYTSLLQESVFLGGTLGLFTGMSFLSMIEIVFWFIKSVQKIPKISKNV